MTTRDRSSAVRSSRAPEDAESPLITIGSPIALPMRMRGSSDPYGSWKMICSRRRRERRAGEGRVEVLVRGAAPRGVRKFFFRADTRRGAGGATRVAWSGGGAPRRRGKGAREDGQLSVQLLPVGAEGQGRVSARGPAEDIDVLRAH